MISSVISTKCLVLPAWPSCPPGFLPLALRRLLVFLAYPSVEGGLLLLWLSLATRPSSSCSRLPNCSTCSHSCWFSARSCPFSSRSVPFSFRRFERLLLKVLDLNFCANF